MKRLMPYQIDASNFQIERKAAIGGKPHSALLVATGLGKTCISASTLKRLGAKSSFTMCPAPLKDYWAENLVSWGDVDPESIFIVRSSKDDIPKNKPNVIVNYEYARYPHIKSQILQRKFAYGQWDEAQRLKSLESLRTGHVLGQGGIAGSAVYKTFLSGTLAPNRAMELFPLLFTMARETIKPYDDEEKFGRKFCGGYYDADAGTMVYKGSSHIEELAARIEPFVFIRSVEQVYPDLPPYIERTIPIPFAAMEATIRNTDLASLRRYTAVSKFLAIRNYLVDQLLYTKSEKMLCFCFTRDLIDLLYNWFQTFGNCVKVYGGVSQKDREAAKQTFLNDPKCRLFFLQYQAGGTGTDGLQDVCNRFVACEPEWSPGERWQAMGRLRRIGQKFPVLCDNLIMEASLDELIMWRCEQKSMVLVDLLKPNNLNYGETTMQQPTTDAYLADIAQSLRGILECLQNDGSETKKETAAQKKKREAEEAAAAQAAAQIANMGLPAQQPALPGLPAPAPALPQLPVTPTAGLPALPTPGVPALPSLPAVPAGPTEEQVFQTVQTVMQQVGARLDKAPDAPEVKQYITAIATKNGGATIAEVPQQNWQTLIDDLKSLVAS